MGKYGQAARIAVQLLASDGETSPRVAWNKATSEVFPGSPSSQAKGCPRDAFLAACEMGLVRTVAPGTYTRSIRNKGYAERAVALLRSDPALAGDEKGLWQLACGDSGKAPNSQMDVVIALFNEGFIR